MALMFTETQSIKRAVALINDIDASKFPRLLSRILQKLHLKDEKPFTEEEEEMLEGALDLQPANLQLVLQTTAFILQQAAYHLAKPAVLSQQLRNIGLEDDKISVFVKAWTSGGKNVVDKLRQRTLPPNQLSEVKWRLNLEMSEARQAKMKLPNAIFELGISKDNGANDRVRIEFNHQQLYEFYNQLEMIQGQLDSLS
ncbi:COMM domain-containing protein 10-like [Anneissia japonica]|uniref:COMM domain-containing protein 10-like n=1 Tax=Anneissia japonica TaxID=1529436 RepID=UPI0014256E1E|nr:COMM domain-containing protein 10-like [Anneissia japonica]